MPAAEYEAKFLDNARRGIDAARAREAVQHMRDLPAVQDMAHIAALCG